MWIFRYAQNDKFRAFVFESSPKKPKTRQAEQGKRASQKQGLLVILSLWRSIHKFKVWIYTFKAWIFYLKFEACFKTLDFSLCANALRSKWQECVPSLQVDFSPFCKGSKWQNEPSLPNDKVHFLCPSLRARQKPCAATHYKHSRLTPWMLM